MIKQTTRNPDSNEENPRNKNPTYPKLIDMVDCTQNELLTLHVSPSFLNVLTIVVPATFADTSKYANTWS